MEIEVRRVEPAQLGEAWQAMIREDLLPQKDATWFAAIEADEVVGVASLVHLHGNPLLDDLWVREDRRRQGIGRLLVAHLQGQLDSLWLIADPDGIAYYERLGFRTVDALPRALQIRYEALGLWPGHLGHLHTSMRWLSHPATVRPSSPSMR